MGASGAALGSVGRERAPETQSGASLGDVRPVSAKGVLLGPVDRGTVCSV